MNSPFTVRLYRILIILSCYLLGACSPNTPISTVNLPVAIWFEGKPLTCNALVTNSEMRWQIRELAFYISDLRIMGENKNMRANLLESDWQSTSVALIRPWLGICVAEQAEADEGYNNHLNFSVEGELKKIDKIAFTLGVPFAQNHLNPLTQAAPLNLPSMFWVWRRGHKFLRIDLESEEAAWAFHLGSVGCESDASVRAPSAPCKQPNRINVELPKNKNASTLVLHLDQIMQDLELTGDDENQSCTFASNNEPACEVLLNNLHSKAIFEWR